MRFRATLWIALAASTACKFDPPHMRSANDSDARITNAPDLMDSGAPAVVQDAGRSADALDPSDAADPPDIGPMAPLDSGGPPDALLDAAPAPDGSMATGCEDAGTICDAGTNCKRNDVCLGGACVGYEVSGQGCTSCTGMCPPTCNPGDCCAVNCPPGGDCGSCGRNCSCEFTCNSGSCMASCATGSVCHFNANGGSNRIVCSSGSSCEIACAGNGPCLVDCAAGAACICTGQGCMYNTCPAAAMACQNDTSVCNRQCPPGD